LGQAGESDPEKRKKEREDLLLTKLSTVYRLAAIFLEGLTLLFFFTQLHVACLMSRPGSQITKAFRG
jgi:hypothetical protein